MVHELEAELARPEGKAIARLLYALAEDKIETLRRANPGRGGKGFSAAGWFAAEQWHVLRDIAIASGHHLGN